MRARWAIGGTLGVVAASLAGLLWAVEGTRPPDVPRAHLPSPEQAQWDDLERIVNADSAFARPREILARLDAFGRTYGAAWNERANRLKADYLGRMEDRASEIVASLRSRAGWEEPIPAFAEMTEAGRRWREEAARARAEAERSTGGAGEADYSTWQGEFRRAMRERRYDDAAKIPAEFLGWSHGEAAAAGLPSGRRLWNLWPPDGRAACESALAHGAPAWAEAPLLDLRNACELWEVTLGSPGASEEELLDRLDPCDARGHGRAALLCYYSGRAELFDSAVAHFRRAAELGYPGADRYERGLAEVRRAQLRGAVEARRWRDAADRLRTMPEEDGKPFRAAVQDGLARLVALGDRYRGTVDELPDGRLRVSYDFDAPAEFDAFRVLSNHRGRPLSGGWRLSPWGIEAGRGQNALLWRFPVKGDLVVEYTLQPLDLRNLSTLVYYHPDGDGHYSFVLSLDIVGNADDPSNRLELENGLPRHALVKQPVPARGRPVDDPAVWAAWRSRILGGNLRPLKLEHRAFYAVRVDRRGDELLLSVDGEPVARGRDGEYDEGYVVFYTDSRAWVRDVRITFWPSD